MSTSRPRRTARKTNPKPNKTRKTAKDRRMKENHDRLMEQVTAPSTEEVTAELLDKFDTSVKSRDNAGTDSFLDTFDESREKADPTRSSKTADRRKRRTKARNYRPWKFKFFFTAIMVLACFSIGFGTILLVEPDIINQKVKDIRHWQYPKTYSNYVNAYAEKYDVDPDLVYAVIYTESHFDAEAGSTAGAVGLMQITPICFEFVKGELPEGDRDNYTINDLTKPGVSIKYGTFFLGYLLKHYELEETAVAAYNAGFSTVDIWLEDKAISPDGKSLQNIPYEETASYVVKVEDTKQIYKEIY